jgi:rRNA maturation endonuclease Nob1
VETGRVGKGNKSDQDLRKVNGTFSDYSFCNYEYQILPESLKAVYANEIRNYCHECGTRIRKSNWKFCPNCGAEL